MKLSIITVNLNNRDGLQKTIDSVICQTFRDFEWIVIDGGSTDGSKELIEQYADHFAYWVSEPDKGIYNAMNKGIRVAQGEYLQFLNSGDWFWNSIALETVFSKDRQSDILYGDMAIINNNTLIRQYPDQLSFAQLYDTSICHQASFIKSHLLKNELYDESFRIASDWKFFLCKALEGCTFEHINATLTVFNLDGISSSNLNLLNQERKIIEEQVIPNCILTDAKQIVLWDTDWQIKEIIKYREKKKLYHKIITATILFINFIDKLFNKK